MDAESRLSELGITRLPCGCIYWTDTDKFWLDPCKNPLCEYRKFIYEETFKLGHPLIEKRI